VDEEIQILKRWKNSIKRRAYIDPASGRHDQIFDPFEWQEDLFWAVREGSESDVDVIPGQPDVADIVDIEQFRDKLFGSLRAPKAYFGFEGDINAKATLSSQDMRWGRAVNGLQRAVKNGFYRLCQIELALHNMDPHSEFEVNMVVPSVLEDLSRLEAIQTLIDVAERMAQLGETLQLDPTEWRLHILRSVLAMSDQEIERYASSEPVDLDPTTPRADDPENERTAAQRLDEIMKSILSSRIRGTTPQAGSERARKEELPPRNAEGAISESNPDELLGIPEIE
ncbi:MAG: portal protein, partial [Gammaproteobacteria bacterium]|nr:portal protein [Gammaproteobacteria bacterium]